MREILTAMNSLLSLSRTGLLTTSKLWIACTVVKKSCTRMEQNSKEFFEDFTNLKDYPTAEQAVIDLNVIILR